MTLVSTFARVLTFQNLCQGTAGWAVQAVGGGTANGRLGTPTGLEEGGARGGATSRAGSEDEEVAAEEGECGSEGEGEEAAGGTGGDKGKKGKKQVSKVKKKESVYLGYCSNTSLKLMRELLESWGWRSVDKAAEARFVWMDPSHANKLDLMTSICKCQRVNFVPGMKEMCNKKPLYRLLNRAKKVGGAADFFFFPTTFVLPEDFEELELELQSKKPKTYICKPDGGAQGAGIFLVRSGQDHKLQKGDKYVVQRYIHRPLLLNGFKFDLRLYVLVTSVDPLRSYLFNDGLARFCTQPYAPPNSKNMDQVLMLLTSKPGVDKLNH